MAGVNKTTTYLKGHMNFTQAWQWLEEKHFPFTLLLLIFVGLNFHDFADLKSYRENKWQ